MFRRTRQRPDADAHNTARPGRAHRQAGQRTDLLHPSQQLAGKTRELLHRTESGLDTGRGKPARTRTLPGAHVLQRHKELRGQRGDEILREHRCAVRTRSERLHVDRPDSVQHIERAHRPPVGTRLMPAHTARLGKRADARPEGDRQGARSDTRRVAHAVKRIGTYVRA